MKNTYIESHCPQNPEFRITVGKNIITEYTIQKCVPHLFFSNNSQEKMATIIANAKSNIQDKILY